MCIWEKYDLNTPPSMPKTMCSGPKRLRINAVRILHKFHINLMLVLSTLPNCDALFFLFIYFFFNWGKLFLKVEGAQFLEPAIYAYAVLCLFAITRT